MQKDKINKIVKLLSSYKNSATIKHEHDTDSQESLLKIAIKYANGGSVIESGSYIRSSINKNPHSFIAHFNMAKLFLKKQDDLYKELKTNKKISKLPKSKEWSVVLDDMCEAADYNTLKNVEPDIDKCLKNNEDTTFGRESLEEEEEH